MAGERTTNNYGGIIASLLAGGHDSIRLTEFCEKRAAVLANLAIDIAAALDRAPVEIQIMLLHMPPDDRWLLDDADGRLILSDTIADLLGDRDNKSLAAASNR